VRQARLQDRDPKNEAEAGKEKMGIGGGEHEHIRPIRMLGNKESQGAETIRARPPAKSVVCAFGVIITDT